MPYRILRSTLNALPYDYLQEVERFRMALMDHRFTLDPAPTAPDIIGGAIRRDQTDGEPDNFVIDVDIVEDVPVPVPPTLADRQRALMATLYQAELAALAGVISPARERVLMLDLAEIRLADGDEPSKAQADLIARHADIAARKAVVHRYFANLAVEVEELTDKTVNGWTFAPFGRA